MKNKRLITYTNHLLIENMLDKIDDEFLLLKNGILTISTIDEIVKLLSLCEKMVNETNDKSEIAMIIREVRVRLLNELFVEKFLSQEFIYSMNEKLSLLKDVNFKELFGDTTHLSFDNSIEKISKDEKGLDDLFGRIWTNVSNTQFENILGDLQKIGVSIDRRLDELVNIDGKFDLILVDVKLLETKQDISNEFINLKTPTILINSNILLNKEELKNNHNLLFWEFEKQHITTLELICINLIELHRSQIVINTFSQNMMFMFSTIDSILQVINENDQITNIKNEFKKILIHKTRSREKYIRFIGHKSA